MTTSALPGRRAGVRRWAVLVGAFAALVAAVLLIRGDGGWRVAATTTGLRARGVVYLKDVRAFVIQTDEGPLGLSAISTHLGDPVAYCRSNRTFIDIRHGSHWDRLGYYLDGPAPRGMDHVETRVRGDVVEIDPENVLAGPGRGAGPAEEPSGPFCSPGSRGAGAGGFLPSPS